MLEYDGDSVGVIIFQYGYVKVEYNIQRWALGRKLLCQK